MRVYGGANKFLRDAFQFKMQCIRDPSLSGETLASNEPCNVDHYQPGGAAGARGLPWSDISLETYNVKQIFMD